MNKQIDNFHANYLSVVAEHTFAMDMNHLWKDSNSKCNILRTEFTKQNAWLSTEGEAGLLKCEINLLDGSLFNSSLILRNLEKTNL